MINLVDDYYQRQRLDIFERKNNLSGIDLIDLSRSDLIQPAGLLYVSGSRESINRINLSFLRVPSTCTGFYEQHAVACVSNWTDLVIVQLDWYSYLLRIMDTLLKRRRENGWMMSSLVNKTVGGFRDQILWRFVNNSIDGYYLWTTKKSGSFWEE